MNLWGTVHPIACILWTPKMSELVGDWFHWLSITFTLTSRLTCTCGAILPGCLIRHHTTNFSASLFEAVQAQSSVQVVVPGLIWAWLLTPAVGSRDGVGKERPQVALKRERTNGAFVGQALRVYKSGKSLPSLHLMWRMPWVQLGKENTVLH